MALKTLWDIISTHGPLKLLNPTREHMQCPRDLPSKSDVVEVASVLTTVDTMDNLHSSVLRMSNYCGSSGPMLGVA